MHIKADTLDDLLRRVFRRLLESGRSINPSRGPAHELPPVLLHLTNPRARLSRTESRGRVFSALGELLWYLAKTDKLAFIYYYIPEYKDASDDGTTINGAYGPRLFKKNGVNQIANVIALLRKRPDSRRAVIQLFHPADIQQARRDVPCTCTMQFILRRGRLDLLTSMRSNDAFLGLPHDVFSFTMLQELVARSVRAELGQYYHVVGSLHLYDRDRRRSRQYLREGWQASTSVMPPMPSGAPWRSVNRLLAIERAIRRGSKSPSAHQLPYWKDLARLLMVFRMWKDGNTHRIVQLQQSMSCKVYAPYIEKMRQQLAG